MYRITAVVIFGMFAFAALGCGPDDGADLDTEAHAADRHCPETEETDSDAQDSHSGQTQINSPSLQMSPGSEDDVVIVRCD